MAIAHNLAATRWAEQIIDGPETRSMQGTNVSSHGDSISSYGWWEMGRIVRDPKGRPSFFLLNGDRYSPSTSQHQGQVRSSCQTAADAYEREHGKPFPILIVPYTALDAAGISKDSIRPLEIREDRWVRTECYGPNVPDHAQHPYVRTGDNPPDDYSRDESRWIVYGGGETHEVKQLEDGRYTWPRFQHFLGDSIFSAVTRWSFTRPITDGEAEQNETYLAWQARYLGSSGSDQTKLLSERPAPVGGIIESRRGSQSEWTYMVREQRSARRKFLSSFDFQETRECYFLCELPRTSAETVEAAYEDLKPKEVKRALASGLELTRQGDVFAIPTALTTRELKSRAKKGTGLVKRAQILTTNHTATEVIETPDGTYGRGILRHEVGAWRTPDHARRKMGDGKTWHRLLRNTVPQARTRYRGQRPSDPTGGPLGGANQSGQARAWTMGGAVD